MPFAQPNWAGGVSPFAVPVYVESTITEPPGSNALVTDVNENGTAVELRFRIPRGDVGADGAPGQDAADPIFSTTVTAHGPTETPSVSISGDYPTKLLSFVLRDGEQGPPGADGAPGLSSSVFQYQFQTATTPPPPNGHVRPNSTTPATTTSIYVAHVDGNGIDQSIILSTIQPGSLISLQKDDDDTIYVRFTTSGLTTNTGWTEFFVTEQSGAGLLTNNMGIVMVVQIAGIPGPPGQDAADPVFTASVTSSGPAVTPAVSLTGTYPNLALGFDLRDGSDAQDPVFTASVVASGTGVTPAVVLTGTYPNLNLGFSLQSGANGSGSTITIANTSVSTVFRLLFTNATSGTAVSSLNTAATALTYNPSTLALTNTGGTFSCTTVTANLTGTASAATAITTVSTTTLGDRYILFSNTVGASATVNVTSALANQLLWNAGAVTMTIGNGTGGVGVLTTNTVNATNFNGTASVASTITIASTQATSERYLCFATGAGNLGVFLNTAAASKIACIPSVPSITMGGGVGGTGVITCNSFVGALTGNASSATAAAITATAVASPRYLVFTPDTTGNASLQISPTLATQIYVQPSVPSLFLGNGITGTGTITCNTINCTTLNGQADGADQVQVIATSTNATRYLLFTPSNNSTTANASVQSAVALTYNPGTTTLTTTNLTVSGTLTATAGSATNLAGGTAGSVPYQSAAGTTTFLGISSIAGTILRSTSTVPTWATPGGFPVSFGGNASAAGMVLQYQLPSALFASTTLNSTLGTPGNGFVTPYSCILVAAAAYSTTSSASATATIHVNGSAIALTTITAGTNFSVTGNRVLTLSATTNTISAGALVEVRVNTAAIGNCQITLYMA